MGKKLGLYLHIPFCRSKCIYCDFCSLPGCSDVQIDEYCAALSAQLRAAAPFCANHQVDTVYFGGGTPSYIGALRLETLLTLLQEQFSLSDQAEITFEANPDSAGPDFLRRMYAVGFNRVSFGIQSFQEAELRTIGRIHGARQAVEAVEAAAGAGFTNISLDLMYGLPDQSMSSWRRTLLQAAHLPVCHISCYGLRPEEHTPLYQQAGLLARLPDDDLQADQYLFAVDFLKFHGFSQYEISNFAVPGRESRHNMKYWRMEEYLGFGAAAHSDFGGIRRGSTTDLTQYIAAQVDGTCADAECSAPSAADRAREHVMLSLRTADGLLLERQAEFDLAHRLCCQGLALRDGDRIRLTPRGYLLSNRIICDFWELLPEEPPAPECGC